MFLTLHVFDFALSEPMLWVSVLQRLEVNGLVQDGGQWKPVRAGQLLQDSQTWLRCA
jgi:hypothetical protein